MIQKIILAVDGSEHSLAASLLIRDLPFPQGSSVTALAVLTPLQTPGRAALMAALDKTQSLLESGNFDVKTGLLHGHPAEELAKFADEHRPDLLVVGAKGLRATLGILLGGVAQQLVEYAHWPVLVVRAPYAGLRRVLLVTDGSTHSREAVDYLKKFPLRADATVEVMHVLPPMPQPYAPTHAWPAGTNMPPLVPEPLEEEITARQVEAEELEGQAIVDGAVGTLRSAGIAATGVLARGDAATEIIEHVKAHVTDLIVAGSRGYGAVKGWLMGSVSRKLVHYAGCSVLIVRSEL
jgi:nucleotide-binding universal stress UspA family protein